MSNKNDGKPLKLVVNFTTYIPSVIVCNPGFFNLTDKALVASASAQALYTPGLRKTADNCQSADKVSTSHDSRATKRDNDGSSLGAATKSDTLVPAICSVPTARQQPARTAVLPAIRYHPYIRSQDATKTADTEDKKTIFPKDTDGAKSGSDQVAQEGNVNEKNCFQPSIHVPTSSHGTPNTGAVHSVTVPKSGSYKLSTKPPPSPNDAIPCESTRIDNSPVERVADSGADGNEVRIRFARGISRETSGTAKRGN